VLHEPREGVHHDPAAHAATDDATSHATTSANNLGKGCEPVSTPSAPFDCQAGYARWQSGWSDSKKTWCCQHGGKGCVGQISYNCDEGFATWTTSWEAPKKAWCCTAQKRGCEPEPKPLYDCDTDFATWHDSWQPGKQAWCCSNMGRGCHGQTTLAPQAALPVAVTPQVPGAVP